MMTISGFGSAGASPSAASSFSPLPPSSASSPANSSSYTSAAVAAAAAAANMMRPMPFTGYPFQGGFGHLAGSSLSILAGDSGA